MLVNAISGERIGTIISGYFLEYEVVLTRILELMRLNFLDDLFEGL